MRLDAVLRLGRVSNLPTVWTNAMAGAVLAGGAELGPVLLAALALSLFYVGGMWLNDAFDAQVDAIERPSRPIPSGAARRGTVFLVGFGLLALGCGLGFVLGPETGLVGLALAGFITLYDWLHKRTSLAPVLMGTTRFLAYGMGACAAGGLNDAVLLGGLGLFMLVVGLTYAARQESYDRIGRVWPLGVLGVPAVLALAAAPLAALPLLGALGFAVQRLFRRAKGDVPRAVVTMIAGIALYDAAMIASAGALGLAAVAAAAFGLTLALQRLAPGT